MNTHTRQNDLPLKGTLSPIHIFSFLIASLLAIASIAGLLYRADMYPTEDLLQSFIPNDVANLFVGLPSLLISMWLAWRGKWIGLLCWPGALFFVFYNYTAYVFAMPLNGVFLLHLVLMMLSVYTLAGLMANMDGNLVQQRLRGAVPEKFSGGVLVALGSLFLLRVIDALIKAITGDVLLTRPELAVNIADFLITPAWIMGGVLLWQRKASGYVAGLGLLFQGSMLFLALIIFLLLQPFLTAAPFAMVDVIVISAMGLICFIPFVLFARGVVARNKRHESHEQSSIVG